ncbi:MAG: phosphodiester glycosidase family protein [Actinomycetes bacterium]
MSSFGFAFSLSRVAAFAVTSTLVVTTLVAVSDNADSASPCHVKTSTRLDSRTHCAGGGVLHRYTATATGAAKGGYNQTGKVVLATYPKGAVPRLINAKVGLREPIGKMVRNQRRQAVAAINGDFFVFPDMRGMNDVEMSRGPMVRDGHLIRATAQRQRVVGVTTKHKPFAGMVAVRGTVRAKGSRVTTPVRALNWHQVKPGGVSIYTQAWSDAIPRPRGRIEWVLNSHNTIRKVRSPARNSGELGDPVRDGTRVIAFSRDTAKAVRGMSTGTTVEVHTHQATGSKAKLLTAVGRGLPMVQGGVAAPLGCNAYDHSKAARPRTFVGWNSRGRWLSLTVPGSTFDGIGLRIGGFGLANAANIARSLGMVRAYELDGGGSTTLYTRSKSGSWNRRDLYGVNTSVCACERPMTNGLAFIKH